MFHYQQHTGAARRRRRRREKAGTSWHIVLGAFLIWQPTPLDERNDGRWRDGERLRICDFITFTPASRCAPACIVTCCRYLLFPSIYLLYSIYLPARDRRHPALVALSTCRQTPCLGAPGLERTNAVSILRRQASVRRYGCALRAHAAARASLVGRITYGLLKGCVSGSTISLGSCHHTTPRLTSTTMVTQHAPFVG